MNDLEIHDSAEKIRDPQERAAFIKQACAGDADRIARVEQMLGVDSVPDGGLPPVDKWVDRDPGSAPSSDPLVGQSIGGVRLVRVISEGGMGRVYEGRQDNPRRTVAVKLVKPGMATDKLIRRFEFEAQVLARLSHPGIAQIFAAGAEGAGPAAQPYFVMEYIAGAKPITQYAEDLKLSNQARLSLFQKVCDAVAYGHQKGVIHRDLKPGNILINAAGEPKVIDFGVAKTTDSDMALTTMQTDVGRLIGTYQYMSPEQFDADPHAIDVRSDVYALGVVLYELLTGQPPYKLEKHVLPEIASIVRQQDPTPITSVNKTLRKDVGIIAGKCLEKDKTRRYSSASELAADIGRHLAGDPIAAVAPTLLDGIGRLARKHKAAATAVAGIAASLVAAVVGISVFAVRAERAKVESDRLRGVVTEERDAATLAKDSERLQRQVAEDSTRKADASRTEAEAEATRAKRQLYVANLYKLQTALDRPGRRLAKEFFQDTSTAYRDAYGATAREPLELGFLRPALDQSIAVLEGHEGEVTAIAYSPDGTRLATGSDDTTARIWDTATGKEVALLEGHEQPVNSIAYSPDGTRLATGSWDATARIWDTATWKEITVLDGHESGFNSVAFSPEGTRLATASFGTTARILDAVTGKELAVLNGHNGSISSIAFSPDGTRLATGSIDSTARIWDAATGRETAILKVKGNADDVASIAFSPDGSSLATGSGDGTARLWDSVSGKEISVLNGHEQRVVSIAFSPDGTRLATGSWDATARLWSVATAKEIAVLKGHEEWVTSVAFSPDGMQLASASRDKTARVWDAATGTELATMSDHGMPSSIAFSPDGRRLATGSWDNTARVWDAATGQEIAVLKGHDVLNVPGKELLTRIESIAFSPDGTRLAAGTWDNTARVWDAATGQEIAMLKGHGDWVTSIAFSPDGLRLATGSRDDTARLWDATTAEELARLTGHENGLTSVAFSPDGTLLATGSWDQTARLWDTAKQEELAVLPHESVVWSIAFSPDGTRLATGSWDNTARLWDAATAKELAVLKGHGQEINSITFSPDGTRLATGSNDTTARLWDAATYKELAVLKSHEKAVTSVAFSPDGTRLATGSWDATARIWGLSNAEIYRNRLASAERRTRLGPLVDDWFTGDRAAVKAALATANATMPPDDWHEASNMVLERASKMLAAASSPSVADQSERVDLIRLSDLAPETCADLHPNTLSLNFWESPLTAGHIAAIPSLPNLTFLNLGSTGLSATGLRDLDRFPRLQRLHLEFLDAEGDDLSMLGDCPTLEFVSLWKSTVGDHGVSTVLDLPRLTHVDLGSTRLGDDLFLNREPHDLLEKLLLDHTAVSDGSVASLSRWTKLKSLDLTGTAITPEGLARLRKALPNCEIVTDSMR